MSKVYSPIRLLRGRVLVEPTVEEDNLRYGSIWLPPSRKKPYPTSGVVRSIGELTEDIRVGDIAIFDAFQFETYGDPSIPFVDQLYIIHEDFILGVQREW